YKYQQGHCARLRHDGVRADPSCASRCLAEVGAPSVVIGLREGGAEPFAPHDVVGRIDGAIPVVIARGGSGRDNEVKLISSRIEIELLNPKRIVVAWQRRNKSRRAEIL